MAVKGRIVALLPRGEAIRNFVYSGALDHIAERCELTVMSVYPNESLRQMIERRFPGALELPDHPLPSAARIARELLELGHGRRLWSEAARERWRRREMEATTPRQRLERRAKTIVALPLANQRALSFLGRVEVGLAARGPAVQEARQLLQRIDPSLVFLGSQVHGVGALPVLEAARLLRIPIAAFCFSWDNLTSQGRMQPLPDEFLVWNDSIARDLVEIYPSVDPSHVHVTGTPQFDSHHRSGSTYSRSELCELIGADPSRPIVLYTTGMPNHMPDEPLLVEMLADCLQPNDEGVRPQLVVRVYAKDTTGRFDELRRRRPEIIFSDPIWETSFWTPLEADGPLWTGLLAHCAVGVNVASTVSLELCMFDKPVLNLAFNPPGLPRSVIDYARYYQFDHYRPIVESGAVDVVRDAAQLGSSLERALNDPRRASAERRALVHAMFGSSLDGRSANRVADVLVRLSGVEQ